MRIWPGLGALLLVLQSAPVGSASQEAQEARITDAPGDVVVWERFTQQSSAAPNQPGLDILASWLNNETVDTFEGGMHLAGWQERPPESIGGLYFELKLRYDDQIYVALHPPINKSCAREQGQLGLAPNEESSAVFIACLNMSLDPSAGTLKFVLPKRLILSQGKVPPGTGSEIEGFWAQTRSTMAATLDFRDRAPNAGPGPGFLFRVGAEARAGNVFLTPVQPQRASNGEATTMVFQVEARNAGKDDDVFVLTVRNDNPDWTIRAPTRLNVAGTSTQIFPVILSMNFTHLHGETRTFEIRAQSTRFADQFAVTRLGVHWLDIPQPAGHHDKLWLHSQPKTYPTPVRLPSSQPFVAWMNAAEKDPTSSDAPVPGEGAAIDTGTTTWLVPLSPDLQIGLDFDIDREAILHTRIRTLVPATEASLSVELYYCEPATAQPQSRTDCPNSATPQILGMARTPTRAINPNSDTAFEVPFRMDATKADLVTYAPGQNLWLKLVLHTNTPQSHAFHWEAPTPQLVVKDSFLQLPLVEYHDPIDQAFQNIGSLRLRPLDDHEKIVNPGNTAVFGFELTNNAAIDQTLRLSVEGVNAEWATLHDRQVLRLAPGRAEVIHLRVQPPADAVAGERAELFLVAESLDDPNVMALARLRAAVMDPSVTQIPDEAPTLSTGQEGRRSNAPGALLLVGILAVVAWRRSA